MRVGKKVLGFKSVDKWQGEIVDGLIHKKQITRTRFEDTKGNRDSWTSFW